MPRLVPLMQSRRSWTIGEALCGLGVSDFPTFELSDFWTGFGWAMTDMESRREPWEDPAVVQWSQLLLNSYRQWVGPELIERSGSLEQQAKTLYCAPFVVVSHGTEEDPVLNYGNQLAQDLWETTWARLTQTPSRLTAEPVNQAARARMLERASTKGYIDDYRGVRISSSGRRFRVEQAIVWNVVDESNQLRGQAATFAQWTPLRQTEN